jgi:hypothetical protein
MIAFLIDFFTVPTFTFRVLYCFFVIEPDRRRILHFNVTEHPTGPWIVQQLGQTFRKSWRQLRRGVRQRLRNQIDSNNASKCHRVLVTLTHPCHPLRGAQGQCIRGPKTDSDDWVLIELPDGKLRRISKAWTSLAPVDPYRLLTSPPLLRVDCLFEVAEWVTIRRKKHTGRKSYSSAAKGALL